MMNEKKIALLIDVENANITVDNFEEILEILKSRGKITYGKVYGLNEKKYKKALPTINDLGFDIAGSMRNKKRTKSELDTRILIDAVLLSNTDNYDIFCVITGAGDLIPLYSTLKKEGRWIIDLNNEIHASNEMLVDERIELASDYMDPILGVNKKMPTEESKAKKKNKIIKAKHPKETKAKKAEPMWEIEDEQDDQEEKERLAQIQREQEIEAEQKRLQEEAELEAARRLAEQRQREAEQRAEEQRLAAEKAEQERLAAEKAEQERLEAEEKAEQEKLAEQPKIVEEVFDENDDDDVVFNILGQDNDDIVEEVIEEQSILSELGEEEEVVSKQEELAKEEPAVQEEAATEEVEAEAEDEEIEYDQDGNAVVKHVFKDLPPVEKFDNHEEDLFQNGQAFDSALEDNYFGDEEQSKKASNPKAEEDDEDLDDIPLFIEDEDDMNDDDAYDLDDEDNFQDPTGVLPEGLDVSQFSEDKAENKIDEQIEEVKEQMIEGQSEDSIVIIKDMLNLSSKTNEYDFNNNEQMEEKKELLEKINNILEQKETFLKNNKDNEYAIYLFTKLENIAIIMKEHVN